MICPSLPSHTQRSAVGYPPNARVALGVPCRARSVTQRGYLGDDVNKGVIVGDGYRLAAAGRARVRNERPGLLGRSFAIAVELVQLRS